MSEPVPNKDHDPAEDGHVMAQQVGQAFQYWPWPKKPLSPFPKSGPGSQPGAATQRMVNKVSSKASKASKSQAKSRSKKHRPGSVNNFE